MTRPLNGFLGSGDALARLHDHAARLRRLQGLLERELPPALASACSVANLKQDTLVLLAHNGAAAAKLRQLAPTLAARLGANGVALKTVQVKVQVHEGAPERSPPVPRQLGTGGRSSVAAFCATLPEDAPLRASLERLLARSRS